MSKCRLKFILCLVMLLCQALIFMADAQTWVAGQNVTLNVNNYALIATNNATVSMNMNTTVAGAAVSQVVNSNLYVKISSIVQGNTKRKITARISSGTVPTATSLTLLPAACTTANSGGVRGTPITTAITLNDVDQAVINGIGTCYTGTGNNDGYRMTFRWSVLNQSTDYDLLESGTYNVTVVFTLTATDGNN